MMLRQLERLRRDEEGMAMIVSLMVAFVVLMLSTIIVAQSIHSLESSGYDRQRLTSVNAAEAGTNEWWQYLQNTDLADLDCDARTETLGSQPAESEFTATATFYRADGATTMSCPMTNADIPAYVKIESIGTAEGEAPRTMETYAALTPIYTGFGAAIMTASPTSFNNNFQVNGQSGNDGDVYVLNGDLTITSSPVIYGNVYVPNGSASTSNNSEIKGDLWANGTVTINNPSKVSSNAKSTTGNVSGSGTVVGDATATGTTPISTVNGSRYPGTNPGPVPTQTFPQITSTTTPWTSAGYTLHTYTGATACTDAKAFLATAPSGKHVLRITGSTACTFSYSGAATTTTVNGDLAVVSDWGFSFSNQSNWNGSAGTVKKLHFISVAPAASCPPDGSTDKDIFVGQRTTFNAQLNVFFYTPCTATMENQNAFAGQVLATNVSIGNQFTMTYTPVLVPGSGEVSGFEQSISYVREV